MTMLFQMEGVLTEALSMIDQRAPCGSLTPNDVIDVIDSICIDMKLACNELPEELRVLRAQANERRRREYSTFKEDYVAETIVMCGLWII